MSAQLGLALPIGTKVRRKSNGEIMERDGCQDKDGAGFYYRNNGGMARGLFLDDEWELIEEKQEPKQGDMIEMVLRDGHWHLVTFVCFYEGAVVYVNGDGIYARKSEWRFPPKKLDVTLQEIAEWKGVDKNLINIINE